MDASFSAHGKIGTLAVFETLALDRQRETVGREGPII
jgi:hypothetical protein